jgi:hypothetical protein
MNGSGKRLFSSAVWNKHYSLLSDAEIDGRLNMLMTYLQTLPFGPFNAVTFVLGCDQASFLAGGMRRECIKPDSFTNEPANASANPMRLSPRKRRRIVQTDNESYDEEN